MPGPLQLELTAYRNLNEWQWILFDLAHAYLADHSVRIDPRDPQARAFADPLVYVRRFGRLGEPSGRLVELGAWMGEQLFGPLRGPLAAYAEAGGGPIYLCVPPEAQALLLRPFEFARFGAESPRVQGLTFGEAGFEFIYRLPGIQPAPPEAPPGEALRVLAGFSVAAGMPPVDLHRQRFELEQFVRRLAASDRPVTLRLVQFAATRDALPLELQAAERWDLVHLLGPEVEGEVGAAAGALANEWTAPAEQGGPKDTGDQEDIEHILSTARRSAPYLPRIEHVLFSLEQAFNHDDSSDSLPFAMPLLRRMAATRVGTPKGLAQATALAAALAAPEELSKREPFPLDLIGHSVERGEHVTVSNLLGRLSTQLLDTDPLAALAVADQMARRTERARLGSWRHIADAQYRLQALNALGRYEQVLQEVTALRERMETLLSEGNAEETAAQWQVREAILEAGRQAAVLGEAWQTALDLNSAIVHSGDARGEAPLHLARRRVDDYSPLVHLGRYDEARDLLELCRATFAAANDAALVGMVHSALADLEDAAGNASAAVQHQSAALKYAYEGGSPDAIAVVHGDLAFYHQRAGADPRAALTHGLAAALIWHQSGSAAFEGSVRSLSELGVWGRWPSFADVVTRLAATPGAEFGALFDRLPRRSTDGDAAIAAVRERVEEARLGETRAKARRSWRRRKWAE